MKDFETSRSRVQCRRIGLRPAPDVPGTGVRNVIARWHEECTIQQKEQGSSVQRGSRVRRMHVVMEKLDFLVRFWELRARYEAIGLPLTKNERFELLSLLQLGASEDGPSAIEAADTSSRGATVQLTASATFLSGALKDLSSERLVVGAV